MNPKIDHWYGLKADTFRQYGCFSWTILVKGFIANRTFRPLITMRLCQLAAAHRWGGVLLLLAKLLHRWSCNAAGIDFSWKANIGAGCAITHGWGLVVSQGAEIGKNVTLFHGVTLGRRDRILESGERVTGFPVIEDEVWIGPHAIIVGGVRVGRGSRIGGGAFVTEHVPPYSVVAGNPSQIVKANCIPDVFNMAPEKL